MTPSEQEQENHGVTPAVAPPPVASFNQNLSATLSADYEALQNDMQQAKDLASDFQRQLAGKSNEFAQLKQLFEKATGDLTHLQAGIVELRAERHRLANESMRGTAYQLKLAQVTGERDRLRVDLEHVRKALGQSADDMAAAVRDRDAQITVLVVELVTAKEALEVARRELLVARPAGPPRVLQPPPGQRVVEAATRNDPKIEMAEDFIDISFGT